MALYERILLATDLGARSDRAMDRAVMLAASPESALTVVHVLEPDPDVRVASRKRVRSELAERARARLAHDLAPCIERVTVRIEDGDAAATVERVALEVDATLVVVGVARVEFLGRFVLGTTVARLARSLPAPLLVVTERPRAPYARVAVAVDLSAASRALVALGLDAFPDGRVVVYHAFDAPSSWAAPDLELHRAQHRDIAEAACERWLASAGFSEEQLARVETRVAFGEPAALLREAAGRESFDLVVIGTSGRGWVSELLVGSVGQDILAQLPCDALIVRSTPE